MLDHLEFPERHSSDRRNPKHPLSITEPSSSAFSCTCSVCSLQARGKIKGEKELAMDRAESIASESTLRSYTWLLEQLGEISNVTIVKFNIPEIVVFRKGRAYFFISQNKDHTLKLVTNQSKLNNNELKKAFLIANKHRKKEEVPMRQGNIQESSDSFYKELAHLRLLSDNKENNLPVSPVYENGPLRVMTYTEFMNLMYERPSSPIWRNINYLQCPKIGPNYHITLNFEDIYDGSYKEDQSEEFLQDGSIDLYCEFVIKKIGFLLRKFCQKQLTRISAEFSVEESGKIWFSNATQILTKDEPNTGERQLLYKRIGLTETQDQQECVFQATKLQTQHEVRMAQQMTQHYEELKVKTGIDKLFAPIPVDNQSSQAFRMLRPLSGYSLRKVLSAKSIKTLLSSERPKTKQLSRKGNESGRTEFPPSTATSKAQTQKSPWQFNPKTRHCPKIPHYMLRNLPSRSTARLAHTGFGFS